MQGPVVALGSMLGLETQLPAAFFISASLPGDAKQFFVGVLLFF